jgi:hypothetical protein
MAHPAVHAFNHDYTVVRRLVVDGTMTLLEAKAWIEMRGNRTVEDVAKAGLSVACKRQLSHRAELELECLRRYGREEEDQ